MDRDLVEQARHGDRDAFGALARSHGDWLFAVAFRMLRNYELAEDAVQQSLVTAWRELPADALASAELFDPGIAP